MENPLFSVVIPTCNRNKDLIECLKRLESGRQSGGRLRLPENRITHHENELENWDLVSSEVDLFFSYEVIVADDGTLSTAESLIREQFPWVNWVKGPQRGPAANRNCGAGHARGAWLVFTDDDCQPDSGWLSGFLNAITADSTSEVSVLEGCTRALGAKPHPLATAPVNENGSLLWSCNLCIKKDVFELIQGFDERFPYAAMEDIDFRLRLEKCGELALFVPMAVIVHPWKRLNLWRHWQRHIRSQRILLKLHPDQTFRFTFAMHLQSVGRYYLKTFPQELRQFGLQAIFSQPMKWLGFFVYGWEAFRRSIADKRFISRAM
jgi:GT2 family glycosyltransferase